MKFQDDERRLLGELLAGMTIAASNRNQYLLRKLDRMGLLTDGELNANGQRLAAKYGTTPQKTPRRRTRTTEDSQ